LITIAQYELER